jgi:hypothetical protein
MESVWSGGDWKRKKAERRETGMKIVLTLWGQVWKECGNRTGIERVWIERGWYMETRGPGGE